MEVDNVERIGGHDWHLNRGSRELAGTSLPRRKRAPVACRRCRRLRSKCVHENSVPPCELCKAAGETVAATCVFLGRSRRDHDRQLLANDREYRQRRREVSVPNSHDNTVGNVIVVSTDVERPMNLSQADVVVRRPSFNLSPPLSVSSTNSPDLWDILPPFEEVVEGCRTFFTACFQLGFLPKAIFLERLTTDKKSISVFFLLSILSVSGRFTKCLVKRYGGATKATDYFINRAGDLIPNEIYKPSLERTQALFLLGVSEWTQGNRTRSAIHLGIAVRMAGIQHLHREESYALPQSATTEDIINSEVARRTFWVLESQDHLYSEHNAAVSFPPSDITALLPSDETDFAYGTIPKERAALGGSQAAIKNPRLVSLQSRSPFATLVQAHNQWGEIARRAGRASRNEREKADENIKPWESVSEYSQLTKMLKEWEDSVPERHRWSLMNLRGHKAEFLDLAYLSQVMVVRINNIVIRRIYLEDILESKLGTSSSEYNVPEFWTEMSHELFTNVYSLHESFDTWFSLRSADEGIPSIVVFCVYICGSLASYLWKWPQLCPELADGAEAILNRSLEVLAALMDRLPLVSRWLNALQKIAVPLSSRSALDSDGQLLHPEKDFVGVGSSTPMTDVQNQTSQGTRRSKETEPVQLGSEATTNGLETRFGAQVVADRRFNSHDHDVGSPFAFTPSMHVDDISWAAESRGADGAGGMSSLDFNSGYSFDEELMRLLQGEM